ncbi:hypothetical protein Ctob_013496, partial [Chrysochromulina tobinii]
MSQTASEIVDPDKVEDGFLSLTFGLLHGPIVQFAAPPPGQSQASVIAMPQQLPLSVDPVFVFPKEASLPDSIAHFCFAPVLKLHEPSELTFTLTDSKGNELHGVSLQVLVPHPSSTKGSGPKHRPVAICMISGRPIFKVLSQLLRSLLPLVQHAKVPTTKRTRELKVRVSRNQYGLGLVMGQNNVVMSVEAGSMAAKERQVRPGDQITALDGEPLNGLKFSDALQRQQAAKEQAAKDAGKVYKAPSSSQHFILMTRTYEVVDEAAVHHDALLHACRTTFGLLRQREQDLKWLVENPFWLPSPIEPLFKAMDYNVTEIAYLIAACLTDQKVAIPPARLPPSALSYPPPLYPSSAPRMAPLISPSDGASQVLLISSEPDTLLPASNALRALLAPLIFSSTYIPYLPATLLASSDAQTLISDSTSPYLIGTHVGTTQTIAADGAALSTEIVIADFDRTELRPCLAPSSPFFPTSVSQLASSCPPVGALIRKLGPLCTKERFDEAAVQAACLEFLAGILNLKEGSLSDSVHPADAAARATWALLLDFEEDVRKRCERDKVVAPHAPLLKEKLKEGLGAALEGVCAKIGGAAAHAHRPGIGQAPKQPCAPFLSLIYASRAFRQWWLTEKSEASQEEQMIIKYREFDLNLTDHVADHRRALHLVEKTLLEALDEASSRALAEATAKFGIPALAASTPPKPVSTDALVSLMTAADAAHTAATPTVLTGGAKQPPAGASPMS